MSNIEELENAPDISLIDTDADTLMQLAVQSYEQTYKEQTGEEINLMPADKETIVLQTMVYAVLLGLIASDVEYKQGSIKYATGEALRQIGLTRCSVDKPNDTAAIVTMKYIFDGPLAETRLIPAGNRVSVDNIYFAVNEDTIANIGDEYVTAICTCTEAGEIGNGYAAGTITTHTDALPWVKAVTNIDTSTGGVTVTDEEYTKLIYNTPDGYSVAGPKDAYIAKAKEFSPSIIDVFVTTPDDSFTIEYQYDDSGVDTTETKTVNLADGTIPITGSNISSYTLDLSGTDLTLNFTKPVDKFTFHLTRGGIVEIYPLLTNSTIPSSAFLSSLQTYLSDKNIRPLADKVECFAPTEEQYSVKFDYYIDEKNSASRATIQTEVANAVNDYVAWQKAKLGRDINPDELVKRVKLAGAKRLVITNPSFTTVGNKKVAKCTNIDFTYKGLE